MKNLNILFLVLLLAAISTVNGQARKPAKSPAKATGRTAPAVLQPKDTLIEMQTDYGRIVIRLYKETPLHRNNFISLVSGHFYDSLLFHRVIKGFMIQGGDPESRNADTGMVLGNGDLGYRIPAEINTRLFYHKRGALAAARDNNPYKESSACQFYIVQGKKFSGEELSKVVNGMNFNLKKQILNEVLTRDSVKARFDDFVLRGDDAGRNEYLMKMQPVVDEEFKKQEYMPDPSQVITYEQTGGAPHLDGSYTVFGEVIYGMDAVDRIAAEPVNAASRPIRNIRMKVRLLIR